MGNKAVKRFAYSQAPVAKCQKRQSIKDVKDQRDDFSVRDYLPTA